MMKTKMMTVVMTEKRNKSKLFIAINLIIVCLFFPEPALQAFDNNIFIGSNIRQQALPSQENQIFDESFDWRYQCQSIGHLSYPFSQGMLDNSHQGNLLRISGIDPDDNGLGEEAIPVGNGIYILLSLSILFILYRFRAKREAHNFL